MVRQLLGGRVTVAEVTPLSDDRGRLTEPIDDGEIRRGEVLHVHVVECAPGAVRANHVHRRCRESITVLHGSFRIHVRDTASGDEDELAVDDGAVVRIDVPAGVGHAFLNTGSSPGFLLAWADRSFDPDDFERCPLLP